MGTINESTNLIIDRLKPIKTQLESALDIYAEAVEENHRSSMNLNKIYLQLEAEMARREKLMQENIQRYAGFWQVFGRCDPNKGPRKSDV